MTGSTPIGLILPYIVTPFGIFTMRQLLGHLPASAARGRSHRRRGAVTLAVSLPFVAVFLVAQRRIMQSFATSGLRE